MDIATAPFDTILVICLLILVVPLGLLGTIMLIREFTKRK